MHATMEDAPMPKAAMEGMPTPPMASAPASDLNFGPTEDAPPPPSELTQSFVNIPKIQGSLPPPMPDSLSITPRSDDFEIPAEGVIASKVPAIDVFAARAGKEQHAVNDAEVKEEGRLSELKLRSARESGAPSSERFGQDEKQESASTAQGEDDCDASKAGSTPDGSTWDIENPHAARKQEKVALRDDSKQSGGEASNASSKEYRVSRKPWRLISNRRRTTMKQHHGKTPLHRAAWYAECITCAAFSLACLTMLCLWARHENEESFVNTFFVTAIAAMTYFAKSCHMGDMVIKGDLVPIARYIDWITTTPLMLYELCHIAHATTPMIIMVIMSDLLMLATGIIAALMPWKPHKHLKQVWFAFSCFFYIMLLVSLQVDVGYKASKQIEVAANLFKQLEMLTIVVWSFYPIIVGMGRAHLGLITKPTEDIILCVLDVVAKIGMEGIIVGSCFNGCVEEGAH
ncbi:unnamed protein product [Prorocentrum cordatum]|uniref:Uncharacterized protein n=1 Tax=Prorocentrum cordatum TaxID=2364126 RepID=A0ABN9R1R7_9DINO|nr:unnamed protein product [Polarella glacialis]